jgi:DNA polymerase-3 subunit delta'
MTWLLQELNLAGVKLNQAQVERALNEAGGAVMDARDYLLGSGEEGAGALVDPLLKALSEGGQINWLGAAELIHKAPMPELLVILERWIADLLSIQQANLVRYYPSKEAELKRCAQSARPNKLSDFWKALLDARRHELHALAHRVQIEALLIRYQEIFKD